MRASLFATVFVCGLIVITAACGGTSSTTAAASDSGTPGTDASSQVGDGGIASDALVDVNVPCTDCVTGTLSWGDDGGRVAYQDESSLATCRAFQRKRLLNTDGGSFTCGTEIGACGAGPVAVGDVESALGHPDVIAAFASTTVVYGTDSRPVDGTVLRITRNGKSIDVGEACGASSAPACVEIPPGVAALVSTLRALDAQELAKPACDAFD
jgi:hypothetical protein